MGCLFVLVLGGLSAAMVSLFGYTLWVMAVLGCLWFMALVISIFGGHHGFGNHGNTDLMIVIAGLGVAAAIIVPNYNAQRPCVQAKMALSKLADAEREYFSAHKTYTTEINSLNAKQNPNVYIMIFKGDQDSFAAAASHASCNEDKKGTPRVFIWDSARGGLQ